MELVLGTRLAGQGTHHRRDIHDTAVGVPDGHGQKGAAPPDLCHLPAPRWRRLEHRPEEEYRSISCHWRVHRQLRRRRSVCAPIPLHHGRLHEEEQRAGRDAVELVRLRHGHQQHRLREPAHRGEYAVDGRRRHGGEYQKVGLWIRILVRVPPTGCTGSPLRYDRLGRGLLVLLRAPESARRRVHRAPGGQDRDLPAHAAQGEHR
mmetsp:Transcript_63200/g.126729  ORF Transcript_63200/g.126729 Transcript_63200/m.126729 type:complete len:205 (-) Transcript_63200:521-1135(-)